MKTLKTINIHEEGHLTENSSLVTFIGCKNRFGPMQCFTPRYCLFL